MLRDVAGFDLGVPLSVARPVDTDAVRALVAEARTTGTPLVPFGRRTAYWRPLDFRDAIAVDLSSIAHVGIAAGVITAGAGALVRDVDDALRARGLAMPIVPDGYGDSTIGAMVATACTAGRGMGNGPFSRWVTGLTVVDGTATVLRTGAAAMLGLSPFVRDGFPDATDAFFGSEGCLGIVTEVHFRAAAPPHLALLRFSTPVTHTEDVLALGRLPLYDTLRATCEDGVTWNVEIFVQSHVSADEADARARMLGTRVGASPMPPPADPWAGPVDGHEEFARTRRLIGVDLIVPYDTAAPTARQVVAMAQRCAKAMHRRAALYLAPEFANIGLHLTYARDDDDGPREAAAFTSELQGVVPYRVGRTWPVPSDRAMLLRLKSMFDPDRILNPAHPLFR